ncbi:M14 family metallopeptidase [Ferruginibacter lapsinanis]|uniref:M14 metallopeptidase family protein n=1 Tax=Ferruginibacter lapsinanis TaxID=563172 RepID=UPI001E42F91F|nr:M14 metallopeptidase family protein [Ferruginibacter lapsinanis]UEG48619.1 M14 family metallopeptidase [Ferruginibacter lapsinanis]
MKKYILLFILSAFSFLVSSAQVIKSPDEFLGYPLGSKYTPHYKIVSYFQYIASAAPQMIKVEQYGETIEGRPLLLAYITSADNFKKLDEIRTNNLRLTGLLKDKPADIHAPVIVWLSYNVHGNEPSSSEVAMKTLYELVNTNNTQSKNYLKNTVVIIDPCLNPDGRDRYVNWFTQVVGKTANADINSREHIEPWPGGRINHYNFDLNRDWAWQTQTETQQRIKKYNEWMPQIHCDYHEQYPDNPYYFAPAAEPLHEVITPWQREFQVSIGRNHAKYFDANGWLYFTRETFDLFYPSYGDTYPMYNGAIGMTYEQAGHSLGGLAVVTKSGDTLTLADRIQHHYITGMSTIEVASANADKLIQEFKKFYDDAQKNGSGEYKTYIITSDNKNKLDELRSLLDNNKIQYGSFNRSGIKGYNYFTGKEESVVAGKYTIGIDAYQPKAALIRVLFEPKSKLSDSVTYDITAWSLPYVYGLKAYAVKENGLTQIALSDLKNTVTKSNYGYLIEYNSIEDATLLADLLKAGFRVRFTEKDFTYKNKIFNKGTLIVLKNGNEKGFASVTDIFAKYTSLVSSVESGFMDQGLDYGSDKIHLIKKPTVALLTGNGVVAEAAGEVWQLFEQQLDYPITLINADDINGTMLKNIDVLIMPAGNYKFLTARDIATDVKNWVRQGGKIIATENAVSQLASNDWGLKLKKSDDEKSNKDTYADVKRYENRERESISKNIPGAIYKLELDNSHPLAFGYPNYYFTLKQNDNLYEFSKDGWNVGVLKNENQIAGFVGNKLTNKIKDGTVIGVQPMGSGSIVYFADNPIFRSFWENGKLIFVNAVFFVGQ